MTSICAKLLIQLNEKKDFKHYYIRYITGYWKLMMERKQLPWSELHPVLTGDKYTDTMLTPQKRKPLESDVRRDTSSTLVIAAWSQPVVASVWLSMTNTLSSTASIYLTYTKPLGYIFFQRDRLWFFFFYDWCWLSCMCLATIFTSVEHALCRDGKKRATFCDCVLTLTSWIYNSQSVSPAVRRQRPGTYKSASIWGGRASKPIF